MTGLSGAVRKSYVYVEYKDDSEIIPRSSSVIVKRVPVAKGKGKVAFYLGGGATSTGPAESTTRPGNATKAPNYHTGAMSKRFDNKEEQREVKPATVRNGYMLHRNMTHPRAQPTLKSDGPAVQDDEQAAMVAMFQAQNQNWEETQEKMSQLVSPIEAFFVLCSKSFLINDVIFFVVGFSQQRVAYNTRGTGFTGGRGRGGGAPHTQYRDERPLPPAYVCYRCGQKGTIGDSG